MRGRVRSPRLRDLAPPSRGGASRIGFRLQWNNIAEPYELASDVNMWEYTGSLRYNLASGNLLPYGRVGYGLARYRLEGLATNGTPLAAPNTKWLNKWTWNAGAGIEVMMIKSYTAPPRDLDLSLRAEWAVVWQNLGVDIGNLPIETLVLLGRSASELPRDRTVSRHEFRLGFTLSF